MFDKCTYTDYRGGRWSYLGCKLHRADGPAVEWADGTKEFWILDKRLTLDEWLDQHLDMTDEEKVMYKLQYG
jgi:hypothetical protein